MKKGAVFGKGQQIDLETGEIGLHSTPTVVKDVVIVGSSFKEGMTVKTHNNTKGLVRAFDVKTGKMLWTFNTIPRPGEFGNDTWENESWAINGNTGVWTQITVDEEAGLVYLPVETPTSDFYGGHRPGNNLFGESLVCVDLKTGQRKWHFQFVHHAIWDHDMSSAAMLHRHQQGREDRSRPSRCRASRATLYVFDRITGQPVWPIVETPVPQSDVPGEKTAPTQPIPMDAHGKPFAYARAVRQGAGRHHRLHAGAARGGAREPEALPRGELAVRAADSRRRRTASSATINIGNTGRRHELARRRARSRNAHLLLAGEQVAR